MAGTSYTLQVKPDVIQALEDWIASRPDPKPTQAEALERMVEIGTHCAPYVSTLLRHLEEAAEREFHEVQETVEALRRALGDADSI